MAMTNIEEITKMLEKLEDVVKAANELYDPNNPDNLNNRTSDATIISHMEGDKDNYSKDDIKNIEGLINIKNSALLKEIHTAFSSKTGRDPNSIAQRDLKTFDEIDTLVKQMSETLKKQGLHKGKKTEQFLKKHITYAGYDAIQKEGSVDAAKLETLFVKNITEEVAKEKKAKAMGMSTANFGISTDNMYQGGSIGQAVRDSEKGKYKMDNAALWNFPKKFENWVKSWKENSEERKRNFAIGARQFLNDMIAKFIENKFIGGSLMDTVKLVGLLIASKLSKLGPIGKALGVLLVALLPFISTILPNLLQKLFNNLTTKFIASLVKTQTADAASNLLGNTPSKVFGNLSKAKVAAGIGGAVVGIAAGAAAMKIGSDVLEKRKKEGSASGQLFGWISKIGGALGIIAGIAGVIATTIGATCAPILGIAAAVIGIGALIGALLGKNDEIVKFFENWGKKLWEGLKKFLEHFGIHIGGKGKENSNATNPSVETQWKKVDVIFNSNQGDRALKNYEKGEYEVAYNTSFLPTEAGLKGAEALERKHGKERWHHTCAAAVDDSIEAVKGRRIGGHAYEMIKTMKTSKEFWSQDYQSVNDMFKDLQVGDIVGISQFTDKDQPSQGRYGHITRFMGFDKKGQPIFKSDGRETRKDKFGNEYLQSINYMNYAKAHGASLTLFKHLDKMGNEYVYREKEKDETTGKMVIKTKNKRGETIATQDMETYQTTIMKKKEEGKEKGSNIVVGGETESNIVVEAPDMKSSQKSPTINQINIQGGNQKSNSDPSASRTFLNIQAMVNNGMNNPQTIGY